jgi:hypothetical protein
MADPFKNQKGSGTLVTVFLLPYMRRKMER